MNVYRQALTGLLTALISILLVVGGIATSLAEGRTAQTAPEPTPTTAGMPTLIQVTILPRPGQTLVATPTPPRLIWTPTIVHPTTCAAPLGWTTHVVQADETLESLARAYHVPTDELIEKNCLFSSASLLPGTTLYVPELPTSTPESTVTVAVCGPPPGWVVYTVKRDDTLFRLSLVLGVSVSELQFANCMGTSSLIRTGARIYVPFLPGEEPTPTATITTPTAAPTVDPVVELTYTPEAQISPTVTPEPGTVISTQEPLVEQDDSAGTPNPIGDQQRN